MLWFLPVKNSLSQFCAFENSAAMSSGHVVFYDFICLNAFSASLVQLELVQMSAIFAEVVDEKL